MGGNRQTAYNWESNASNAGSDYQHQSDEWPCTRARLSTTATSRARSSSSSPQENRKRGHRDDRDGPDARLRRRRQERVRVRGRTRRRASAGVKSLRQEAGASAQPDARPRRRRRLPGRVRELPGERSWARPTNGGIKFYSLDNEPALWPSTHPRVHPERDHLRRDGRSAPRRPRRAIRDVDPAAHGAGRRDVRLVGVQSLSDAPDAKAQNAKYGTYLDYFLASMKQLEKKHERRLVARAGRPLVPGGARHASASPRRTPRRKTVAARLQAPRSLWDPTYTEKSWITAQLGQADPPDPVAAGADRRALPGHQAGDDRVQLRRAATTSRAAWRRPTCSASSAARACTWPTTGATAPATASCRRTSRRRSGSIATTTARAARSATPRSPHTDRHRQGVGVRGDRFEAARAS